jgi:signal transduction histidine kinase
MSSFSLRFRSARLDRSIWLVVLFVLAMLLPAACVLWFMNEAVTAQSAAAERSVRESYRAQLRLVRSRVEAHWREEAAALNGGGDPQQRFADLVRDGADGAILFGEDGRVAFPQASPGRALGGVDDPLALSLAVVGAGQPPREPGTFQPTAVRDVWAFTSNDRRTVALYRIETMEQMLHDLLHEVTPAGILFYAFAPSDADEDPEAIAAGVALPSWQLSFQPLADAELEAAGSRQRAVYMSVAAAGIAAMALLAIVAGRMFRRHLRLARLKTDLVAAVSHELRTPLASMRVLVDGLLEDAEVDPVKTRDYLCLLATENARLSRLIENFLTFSRLERGHQQFVFAPAQPSSIVSSALEAMRDRLPAGCDLHVQIDPDLPPVIADADALVTALINLLDNAVKYTPLEKRILLRVHRDARGVVFAVQDNGIGIPAREQRRIFRRFYRVDQRLTRETSGVGLGLSIVDLIARAHGGAVTVHSESGAGSTFTLRLPRASAEIA